MCILSCLVACLSLFLFIVLCRVSWMMATSVAVITPFYLRVICGVVIRNIWRRWGANSYFSPSPLSTTAPRDEFVLDDDGTNNKGGWNHPKSLSSSNSCTSSNIWRMESSRDIQLKDVVRATVGVVVVVLDWAYSALLSKDETKGDNKTRWPLFLVVVVVGLVLRLRRLVLVLLVLFLMVSWGWFVVMILFLSPSW